MALIRQPVFFTKLSLNAIGPELLILYSQELTISFDVILLAFSEDDLNVS